MTSEVLFVCTGNICRSPVAERLLPTHLSKAREVIASSAGTQAVVGAPVHDVMRSLLSDRGVVADDFVARRLTEIQARPTAVVLTMTLEHRSAVAAVAPAAARRTFTLLEFAALCEQVVPLASGTPEGRLAEVVQWARTNRGPAMANHAPESLDIEDPYGRDPAAYLAAFNSIDLALARISRTLDL